MMKFKFAALLALIATSLSGPARAETNRCPYRTDDNAFGIQVLGEAFDIAKASVQRAAESVAREYNADPAACFEASQAIDRLSLLLETLAKAETLCRFEPARKSTAQLQELQLDLYPAAVGCQIRTGESLDRAALKERLQAAARKFQAIRL